jgi:hypothetical protein
LTKICQKCKTKNLDEAKFCEKCGNDLSEVVNTPGSVQKNKRGFLRRNWIASILGLIIGLLVTVITAKFAGYYAFFFILPIVSGVSSVYLKNDQGFKDGAITGILSIIIVGIIFIPFLGLGIFLMLLGALGGVLGVLLNKFVFKSGSLGDEKTVSRIVFIQKWWDKQGNGIRILTILAIAILGILLFVGFAIMSTW